jgi:ferrochelatase
LSKKGILLVNLGTPDQATASAIRKYLSEFLMDKKVIGAPFLIRWILVNLIIIPLRLYKVVKKYQSIWMKQGSPLLVYSNSFFEKLKTKIDSTADVYIAMRYGDPSLESTLDKMRLNEIDEINLIPLYPQFAEATTGTAIDKVKSILHKKQWDPKLQTLYYFFDKQEYIEQSASLIKNSFELNLKSKLDSKWLLFSFHGLPESQIKQVQNPELCYRQQCLKTAELIAKKLELQQNEWSVSFQSRLGPTRWIGPSTAAEIKRIGLLSQEKPAHLFVHCPSFVVDCLETLEEIDIEAKKHYLKNGGKQFTYIPCLNDSESWVEAFRNFL